MTLPSSTISVNDVNVETGRGSGANTALSWVKDATKAAYRPTSPNLASVRGYAYYTRNADGNCNNGNCGNCSGNCGNIQCQNCYTSAINCANCDGQNWIQPNCNCACTYNCNNNEVSYNCNCDCYYY